MQKLQANSILANSPLWVQGDEGGSGVREELLQDFLAAALVGIMGSYLSLLSLISEDGA